MVGAGVREIIQIQNGTSRTPSPTKCDKEIIYMKATGIVRRIDDLGRVVIPKEIRRTMRIREGERSIMEMRNVLLSMPCEHMRKPSAPHSSVA